MLRCNPHPWTTLEDAASTLGPSTSIPAPTGAHPAHPPPSPLPLLALKPYVQASVGYLATRTGNVTTGAPLTTTFGNQYLAYEILGGIDYPLVHFLDLRLIEIGAGQGLNIFAFGSTANATLFTVNTGLVVHF